MIITIPSSNCDDGQDTCGGNLIKNQLWAISSGSGSEMQPEDLDIWDAGSPLVWCEKCDLIRRIQTQRLSPGPAPQVMRAWSRQAHFAVTCCVTVTESRLRVRLRPGFMIVISGLDWTASIYKNGPTIIPPPNYNSNNDRTCESATTPCTMFLRTDRNIFAFRNVFLTNRIITVSCHKYHNLFWIN